MSLPVKGHIVVLVVEDEALLLFSIADDLRDLGFEVFEARSADEALVRLNAHAEISAVFTDIDMPGSMDGLALAAFIARHWPQVKVVVTSGKKLPGPQSLPERALFVAKPYALDAVAKALG